MQTTKKLTPGRIVLYVLLILFAGSSFFQWFPSRGLFSDNWDQLSWFGKTTDYLWHLVLPMIAMAVGSFTAMTFLTKNSFLDEIRKQYVVAARAKGLNEKDDVDRLNDRNLADAIGPALGKPAR